jgi:hypothetical protein
VNGPRKKQSAHPPAADSAPGDQEAPKPAIPAALIFILIVIIVIIVVLVGIGVCVPVAKQFGEKQTTHPAAAEQPARYHETQQPAILATTFLVIVIVVLDVILVQVGLCVPPAKSTREKQSP